MTGAVRPTGRMRYPSHVPSEWPRPDLSASVLGGEAVTLWRLRHASGQLHCFVAEWPDSYWLAVECAGGELVISETVPEIGALVRRADAIRNPLLAEGWSED